MLNHTVSMMIQPRLFKIFIYINMPNIDENVDNTTQEILKELEKILLASGIPSEDIQSTLNSMLPTIEAEVTKMITDPDFTGTCDFSSIVSEFENKLELYNKQLTTDDFANIEITIANIYSLIDIYRQVYEKHYNRMKELSETRITENNNLNKNIDNTKKLINTNKRKTVYEKREFKGQETYRLILFITFYVLLGLYLLFGNFFSSRLYRNRMFMTFFLPLCIIPLIVKYIVRVIYFIIKKIRYFLNNNAPKNVYTNI